MRVSTTIPIFAIIWIVVVFGGCGSGGRSAARNVHVRVNSRPPNSHTVKGVDLPRLINEFRVACPAGTSWKSNCRGDFRVPKAIVQELGFIADVVANDVLQGKSTLYRWEKEYDYKNFRQIIQIEKENRKCFRLIHITSEDVARFRFDNDNAEMRAWTRNIKAFNFGTGRMSDFVTVKDAYKPGNFQLSINMIRCLGFEDIFWGYILLSPAE
jgi:hypothetical protein